MDNIDKLNFWLTNTIRALLLIAAFLGAWKHNWINFSLALFTLFLTFLPSIIHHKFKVNYPSEIQILILFLIYTGIYLGEAHHLYNAIWWWDVMLHALSAIIIGAIGFSLVYILNHEKKITLSPLFVAIFAASFAIAIGAIWEIFEFSVDHFFGWNMQKSGLIDTMWDLIVDSAGAVFFAILGYLYLKGNIQWVKRLEDKFIKNNPHIFSEKKTHKSRTKK
ncbi:hypothetical protein ACFL0V_01520 [Nanoarchaeota archaeon]